MKTVMMGIWQMAPDLAKAHQEYGMSTLWTNVEGSLTNQKAHWRQADMEKMSVFFTLSVDSADRTGYEHKEEKEQFLKYNSN